MSGGALAAFMSRQLPGFATASICPVIVACLRNRCSGSDASHCAEIKRLLPFSDRHRPLALPIVPSAFHRQRCAALGLLPLPQGSIDTVRGSALAEACAGR